jgi:hypothetical protein
MAGLDSKSAPAAVAAGLEVLTGAALFVAPSLVAKLLFGSGMNASGDAIGRIAGLVMLCLAAGCFPRANAAPPLAALLALSLVATVYLVIVGIKGATVGVLLWPAAVTHLVLALFVARAFMESRRSAR